MTKPRIAPRLIERDCIVRAYGQEPVKLRAFSAKDVGTTRPRIAIIVGRSPDAATIGFPLRDVFEWNDDQFAALQMAYESGNSDALAEAWRRTTPFSAERGE